MALGNGKSGRRVLCYIEFTRTNVVWSFVLHSFMLDVLQKSCVWHGTRTLQLFP